MSLAPGGVTGVMGRFDLPRVLGGEDTLSDHLEVSHCGVLVVLREVFPDSARGEDWPSVILVVTDGGDPCSFGRIPCRCVEIPNVSWNATVGRVDTSHGTMVDVGTVGVVIGQCDC